MEFILRLEVYTLFFIYPILMGLLLRRKKITLKQVILTTNIFISVLSGTLYLYAVTLGPTSPSVFMLSLEDWVKSISLSIFIWLFMFLMTRPFYKD